MIQIALQIILVFAFITLLFLRFKYEKELEFGIQVRDEGMLAITRLNSHLVDMIQRQDREHEESKYFELEDTLKELLLEANTQTDEKSIRRVIDTIRKKQEVKG